MYVLVDSGANLENAYVDFIAFNISNKSSYSFGRIINSTLDGWNVSRLF